MYASRVSRHVSRCNFLNKFYHVLVYYDSILVTERKSTEGSEGRRVSANGSGESRKCVCYLRDGINIVIIYVIENIAVMRWNKYWKSVILFKFQRASCILFSDFHY